MPCNWTQRRRQDYVLSRTSRKSTRGKCKLKQLKGVPIYALFYPGIEEILFNNAFIPLKDLEGIQIEDFPRHTINTLQVYGQEKYLVLQVSSTKIKIYSQIGLNYSKFKKTR